MFIIILDRNKNTINYKIRRINNIEEIQEIEKYPTFLLLITNKICLFRFNKLLYSTLNNEGDSSFLLYFMMKIYYNEFQKTFSYITISPIIEEHEEISDSDYDFILHEIIYDSDYQELYSLYRLIEYYNEMDEIGKNFLINYFDHPSFRHKVYYSLYIIIKNNFEKLQYDEFEDIINEE